MRKLWSRKGSKPGRVEVYQDAAGKWRWRSIARNGKVIGAAEQGYSTKYYAMAKAERYAEAFGVPAAYVEG